jgi:hypothetical protein
VYNSYFGSVEDTFIAVLNIYLFVMCLTNYGASEAVNLCNRYGTWRNPPNIHNRNAPVILENKISCSLTIVCVSSF